MQVRNTIPNLSDQEVISGFLLGVQNDQCTDWIHDNHPKMVTQLMDIFEKLAGAQDTIDYEKKIDRRAVSPRREGGPDQQDGKKKSRREDDEPQDQVYTDSRDMEEERR